METDNETTIVILMIGIIILVYNFSDNVNETFIIDEYQCPVYEIKSKLISIIHHPKLNKGFIVLVSCKKANSIIQKSLKNADGIYSIENNGRNYYLLYKGKALQNIVKYSLDNYEHIKIKTGFRFPRQRPTIALL